MADDATHSELLARIAGKDREALAVFYDETANALFSLALRILTDPEEAAEVTQDVYVQIWENAGAFDRKLGAPLGWAIGITRNRSIDRLRARARRQRLISELEAQAEPATPQNVREAEVWGDCDIATIRAAVANLPSEQRQALELAFFHGLTHHEIAG